MIAIHIFEENHRCSEQTPQLAPRSVVGAANLAAGGNAVSSRGGQNGFRSL